MVKKKSLDEPFAFEETTNIEIVETSEPNQEKEDLNYANLLAVLQEIGQDEKVIGFILRNDDKATIDLEDPAKIMEYAILSSQTFESSDELSTTFAIGDMEYIIVEGRNIKMICMKLGENKLSIFTQSNADHTYMLDSLSVRLQ